MYNTKGDEFSSEKRTHHAQPVRRTAMIEGSKIRRKRKKKKSYSKEKMHLYLVHDKKKTADGGCEVFPPFFCSLRYSCFFFCSCFLLFRSFSCLFLLLSSSVSVISNTKKILRPEDIYRTKSYDVGVRGYTEGEGGGVHSLSFMAVVL